MPDPVGAIDRVGNTRAPAERNWYVAVPDSDGDGYNANADCNDGDASINPGRRDLVNNDVDENCDGMKELDRDNDGSRADTDCDDNNPARTPGTVITATVSRSGYVTAVKSIKIRSRKKPRV